MRNTTEFAQYYIAWGIGVYRQRTNDNMELDSYHFSENSELHGLPEGMKRVEQSEQIDFMTLTQKTQRWARFIHLLLWIVFMVKILFVTFACLTIAFEIARNLEQTHLPI